MLMAPLGGTGYNSGQWGAGGLGGRITALINVSAGQTLYILVGGAGASRNSDYSISTNLGGYNGGGPSRPPSPNQLLNAAPGGGATDVRTRLTDLTTRLVVAGGGGGASSWSSGGAGGGPIGGNGAGGHGGGGCLNTGGTQLLGGVAPYFPGSCDGRLGSGGGFGFGQCVPTTGAYNCAGGGGGGILVAQHSLIICRVNGHLQRKIICVLAAEVLAEGRASLLATSSSMHKEFTRETGNLSLPRSATRHIQRHRPHPHHRRRPRRRPRRRRPRRRPRRRRRRRQAAPAAASIP